MANNEVNTVVLSKTSYDNLKGCVYETCSY